MQTSQTYFLVLYIVAPSLQKYCFVRSIPDTFQVKFLATHEILKDTTSNLFNVLKLDTEIIKSDRIQQLLMQYWSLVNISEANYKILDDIHEITRLKTANSNETFHFAIDLNQLAKEIIMENLSKKQPHLTNSNKYKNRISMKDVEGNNTETHNLTESGSKIMIAEFLKDVDKFIKKHLKVDRNTRRSFGVKKRKKYWEPKSEVQSKLLDLFLLETRRLFKGKTAKINSYPFVASIHIFRECSCGGAIIHKDLVITAASCLQIAHNNRLFRENANAISVRVGSDFCSRGGEEISVVEIYFHPQYDPQTLLNNLAIVRLSKHLFFTKRSSSVRKLKKIRYDQDSAMLSMGHEGVTVLGWGERHDGKHTDRLGMTQLDIYATSDCKEIYSSQYMTEKNFCGGFLSKGAGACNRDAGDPGIVDGLLVGVVSYGPMRCGSPGAPTVFTKLGYYTQWIDEIMQSKPLPLRKKMIGRSNLINKPNDKLTEKTTPSVLPLEFTTITMINPILKNISVELILTHIKDDEKVNQESHDDSLSDNIKREIKTTLVEKIVDYTIKETTVLHTTKTVKQKHPTIVMNTKNRAESALSDNDEKSNGKINNTSELLSDDDDTSYALSIQIDNEKEEVKVDENNKKENENIEKENADNGFIKKSHKTSEEEENRHLLELLDKLTVGVFEPVTIDEFNRTLW